MLHRDRQWEPLSFAETPITLIPFLECPSGFSPGEKGARFKVPLPRERDLG